MRYVVVGAGAVGGVIGGLLSDAGREVALVARGEHGARIAEQGLRVRRPHRDIRVRVEVAARVADLGLRADDVVVVAVKSQQTGGVLDDLAAARVDGERATDAVPLLMAQNGIANEDAALRLGAAVHGVCLNLPATHLEPGTVIGEGDPVAGVLTVGLAVGGTDAVDAAVTDDLVEAGFLAGTADDVMAWKRAKLLRNVGNAIQALGGSEPDPDQTAAVQRLDGGARAEARACFAAAGWTVVDDDVYRASGARFGTAPVAGEERGGGSTWQSVARGQGTVETDWLNGDVVRLGRLHGVATPVNAMLQREMARLVATGGRPGSRPPAELLALL